MRIISRKISPRASSYQFLLFENICHNKSQRVQRIWTVRNILFEKYENQCWSNKNCISSRLSTGGQLKIELFIEFFIMRYFARDVIFYNDTLRIVWWKMVENWWKIDKFCMIGNEYYVLNREKLQYGCN